MAGPGDKLRQLPWLTYPEVGYMTGTYNPYKHENLGTPLDYTGDSDDQRRNEMLQAVEQLSQRASEKRSEGKTPQLQLRPGGGSLTYVDKPQTREIEDADQSSEDWEDYKQARRMAQSPMRRGQGKIPFKVGE